MNIKSIKNRASTVLLPYRDQFIRVLMICMVLQAIPSLLNSDNTIISILSTILSIVFLPVAHGIKVASLKIVRNNGESVEDNDGLVGFTRFKELFPTYVIVYFISFVISFVLIFVFGLILGVAVGTQLTGGLLSLSTGNIQYILTAMLSQPAMLFALLIMALVIVVVTFVVEALLMSVPYLLEQYHITGMEAIKASVKLMKNHLVDYLKFYFSFFGWMFIAALIEAFLSQFIPVTLIVTVIVGLFKIFTYLPLYYASETVLFEEIAFYEFNEQVSE